MIFFHKLSIFEKHYTTIKHLLVKQDIFFVGGSIRDVLLGINNNPTDIDIATSGNPDKIRETIKKQNNLSSFYTKKFGTITFFHSDQNKNIKYTYELTPFRMESQYCDNRHPEKITRTRSILQDAKRRDFTINCIYLTLRCIKNTMREKERETYLHDVKKNIIKNESDMLQKIQRHKSIYIIDCNVCILQDHRIISSIFSPSSNDKIPYTDILKNIYVCSTGKSLSRNTHTNCITFLIDPFGGLCDMIHKKIRCVGEAQKRITEDALRILRGVRFPIIINQAIPDRNKQNSCFIIEKSTRQAMMEYGHLVQTLAKERIYQELMKVFQHKNPFGYVCLLDKLKLIRFLFPSLAKCKGNEQPTIYHPFDTYNHTILTLHALQKLEYQGYKFGGTEHDRALLLLAMLYHDVGKPKQYQMITQLIESHHQHDVRISHKSYQHHSDIGINLADQDFKKLGFSRSERNDICRYIKHHHRPGEILNASQKNQTQKLRKLLSDGGILKTVSLIQLAIADRLGQYNPLQNPAIQELYQMIHIVKKIYHEEGRFTQHDLAINGNDIIESFHISPGPRIGLLLRKSFDRVIQDISGRNTKVKILQYLKSIIKCNKA